MGLNTAMKAMQVYSYAIDTTAHNIANASDPNYSQQLADITASTPLNLTPGGQIGTGSTLAGIERIRDTYLDSQIMEMEGNVGNESILNRTYQNLAAIFPEIDGVTSGLQAQMNQFFTDWQNLATQAASGSAAGILSAQNTIYADASTMVQSFNAKATSLNDMRSDLTTDLTDDINKANGYISNIYSLNQEIKQEYGMGQTPNDLLDQRNAAMTSLSELVNFTTQTSADGTVTLILGGTPLVSGATSCNLLTTVVPVTEPNPPKLLVNIQDPSQPLLGIQTGGAGSRGILVPTSAITGGEIAGILNSRDTVVPYYLNKLDETANSLITVVNQIESAGNAGAATQFFTGTDAMNMGIDPSKLVASNIAYSSGFAAPNNVNNDIATIIGNLGNKLVSTFTYTTNGIGLTNNQTLPTSGTITINGINISYTTANTVAWLVNAINAAGGNAISAVFNNNTKQLWLYSTQGLTITDSGAMLSKWGLKEAQWSAAEVTYPNTLAPVTFMNDQMSADQYYFDTIPSTAGLSSVITNGVETDTTWTNGAPTSLTASTVIGLAFLGTGYKTGAQAVFSDNSKIELADFENGIVSTNVVTSFQISDKQGNLTQALNLVGNVTFNDIYQSTMDKLSGDNTTASNMLSQYQASLTQLQTMQQQVTQVNVDNQNALAATYQMNYDASVRLENTIDAMLNTLINNTGTPSNSTTSSV